VDYGIACSMSRAGNVWDNAAMKGFFSSLKTERSARKTYRTRDQAKADVLDCIEHFYNPRQGHWTIGYLGPMEFEKLASLAWRLPNRQQLTCEAHQPISDNTEPC
jgi:putative transposase